MSDRIRASKADVSIERLAPPECDGDCDMQAVQRVVIQLAAIGQAQTVGQYCGVCALNVAERLRASLPKEKP